MFVDLDLSGNWGAVDYRSRFLDENIAFFDLFSLCCRSRSVWKWGAIDYRSRFSDENLAFSIKILTS